MFRMIVTLMTLIFTASLQGAQLHTLEAEKKPTKVVLIKGSSAKSGSKVLKTKQLIQKELGLKLKLDSSLNYKSTKRYIANREITPEEQRRLERVLNTSGNKSVIFVVGKAALKGDSDAPFKAKRRSNRNNNSVK